MVVILTIIGFILGAVPFALLIGRYGLGVDIREYGDKNPGATNVLRAGNVYWFALALMLDISKGALPVGLAYYIFGIQGWQIVPVTIAPPLGHSFSPFLNWQGGKAIAASFGVWIGLTLWQMPLISLSLLIIFTLLLTPSGWAVILTLAGMLVALLLWLDDPVLLGVWAAQTILLAWTHRKDLGQWPQLRPLQTRNP